MPAVRSETDAWREKKAGVFPCILYWGFNHFVVCDGFRGDEVYLNDPARGDIHMPVEMFDESYTGVCMILYLDQGRIIEEGTYDELIAKGGAFAKLVERQQVET